MAKTLPKPLPKTPLKIESRRCFFVFLLAFTPRARIISEAFDLPLGSLTVYAPSQSSGGIVILAHPARYRLPFNKLINEASSIGFDGAVWWQMVQTGR